MDITHMRVHHIGYLVKNIYKSKQKFEQLGYVGTSIICDNYREINICFLEKDGNIIELVSPTTVNSVVSYLIKRYKNSPYHICFESSNFEKDINKLCKDGYTQIHEISSAIALNNKRVVFLMSPEIGIVEVLER